MGHEIASRMAYLGETLDQAAARLIHQNLAGYGIGTGLVGIATGGTIVAPSNTDGMFRGWVTSEGKVLVASHDMLFQRPDLPHL